MVTIRNTRPWLLLLRTEKLIYTPPVTISNMHEKEAILAKNIKEFYTEANAAMQRKAYNSATSLFFKALAVLADWLILKKEGFIPKNHAERFRILQMKYPEIYQILDKDFPAYQESYTLTLTKEIAEVIKGDVRKVAKKTGFALD